MSNSVAANIPTDDELNDEMALAFNHNTEGTALLGSAEQRGAYCVYAHYTHLTETDPKTQRASPESMLDSPKARTAILDEMLARFSPALTKDERKDRSDDAMRATTQVAHKAMLDRSLKLAAILMAHNVALAEFNRETGMWTVPVDLLLDHKRNETALGRLTGVTSTVLDGQSFLLSYENKSSKQDYDKATASTTRLRSLHIKVTPRVAGGSQSQDKPTTQATPAKETAVTKALGGDVDKLVRALAKQVMDVPETVPVDDSEETRSFFTDLAVIKIWLTRQEAAQANANKAKATTKATTRKATANKAA